MKTTITFEIDVSALSAEQREDLESALLAQLEDTKARLIKPRSFTLLVQDQPGQPHRYLNIVATDLLDASRQADKLAAKGFIGGSVAVIDNTEDHPDHRILYKAIGKA